MAEVKEAPGKTAAGLKGALTKKIGPLPGWVWAAVAIGGYFLYQWYSNRNAATPPAATAGQSGGLSDGGGGTSGGTTGQSGNPSPHHKPPKGGGGNHKPGHQPGGKPPGGGGKPPCAPGHHRVNGKCQPIGHGQHHGGGGGGGGGGNNHNGGGGGGGNNNGGGGGGGGGNKQTVDTHAPDFKPPTHMGGGKNKPTGHGSRPNDPGHKDGRQPVRSSGRPQPHQPAPHPQDHGR